MSDSIVEVGGRIYVKCTATLNGSINVSVDALAREPESRKGMDESQITGAASSYARKYALNGLFAIDDTKDADATNKHESEPSKAASKPAPKAKPAKPKEDPRVAMAKRIESGKDWIEVVAWTRGPLAGKTLSDAAANGEVKAIQDILDYLDPVALEHEEAVKRLKQALTEAKTMMDERGNAAKARGDEPDDDGIDRPF